jgi:hypothetical protein
VRVWEQTSPTNPHGYCHLRCGTRHAFNYGKEGATVAVGYKKIHLAQRKPSVAYQLSDRSLRVFPEIHAVSNLLNR